MTLLLRIIGSALLWIVVFCMAFAACIAIPSVGVAASTIGVGMAAMAGVGMALLYWADKRDGKI